MDGTENHGTKRDLENAIPGLMAFREKEGAHTPRGYLSTGIIEGVMGLATWERQPWVCDERQTPHYWIKKNLARLGG
jgi:hypothetical protein